MNNDTRNTIIAIALSFLVLVAWQYFIGGPEAERVKREALAAKQATPTQSQLVPGSTNPSLTPQPTAQAGTAPQSTQKQATQAPRILIDTPKLKGSLSLEGGRIDDLTLKSYRETVDAASANIKLFQPSGSAAPFYAEFGFVGVDGLSGLPQGQSLWSRESGDVLSPGKPVVLRAEAGGLVFKRTYSVDEQYLFRIEESIENRSEQPKKLHGYGLIARHGTPQTLGFFILHEGLIGVLGEKGLQEYTYSDIDKEKMRNWRADGGFVGITDKYWAAAVVPQNGCSFEARFASAVAPVSGGKTYQSDYLMDAVEIAPKASVQITHRLFAGAKEVKAITGYQNSENILRFDLLIDWGWFYFFTKPLFHVLDYFNHLTGNFGIAILIVTVLVKLLFFPLANKSYESMSKMKKVHPEMLSIRDRFADDKLKQQQELMALYKREKINPAAGCLPILLQIPVFFALYKVLFVTIEMRHAPFYGWIRDLAAPDPTSIFNLFGLIAWTPPSFLMLGIWPILMGITMFVQMQMNPAPTDPIQKIMFSWMPIVFTFLLATFPAGLVIYWTWNNFLSILQQYVIMNRMGVKVELMDNMREMVGLKKRSSGS